MSSQLNVYVTPVEEYRISRKSNILTEYSILAIQFLHSLNADLFIYFCVRHQGQIIDSYPHALPSFQIGQTIKDTGQVWSQRQI